MAINSGALIKCSIVQIQCETTNSTEFGVSFDLTYSRRGDRDILGLTINIGETPPTETIFGDFVTTVRKFRLELKIQDGEMPGADHGFRLPLKSSMDIKRIVTSKTSSKKESTSELEASVGLKNDGFSAGIGAKGSKGKILEESSSLEDSFELNDSQVIAMGNDSTPCWNFEDQERRGVLKGGFKDKYLGVLVKKSTKCKIDAQIIAYRRDLVFKGASGLFPSNMSKNNLIARNLALFKFLGIGKSVCCRKCFEIK